MRKQTNKKSILRPVKAFQERLRILDMVEVTGSTPVGPTTELPSNTLDFEARKSLSIKTTVSKLFPQFPPFSKFWCGNGEEKTSFYAGPGGALNNPLHQGNLRTAESGAFYAMPEITPDFSTKGWGSGLAPYAEPEGAFNLFSENRLNHLFGSAPFYSWVNCAVRHQLGEQWRGSAP